MAHAVSRARSHRVQFYNDAAFLAERVAIFVQHAFDADGASLVVARPQHLALIEEQLGERGFDLESLRISGRIVFADADITLDLFARGPERMPVPAMFHQHIGRIVRDLRATAPGPLHVYGEMVDVLWAEGRHESVMRLEQLWGELQLELDFSLLCGYRMSRFDADTAGFDSVCGQHDDAALQPQTASYSIAQLAQRARALEVEVDRRRRLENRMLELLEYTGQLTAARSPRQTAKITIDSGMKAVGAIAATLWVLSKDRTRLEMLAASDDVEAKYRSIDLQDDVPLVHAVRDGKAIFLGSRAEYKERFPDSFRRVGPHLTPRQIAFAMLPVAGDGQTVGVICFTYDHERVFDGPDRTFKTIVARHCGLALDRVHLHEQERLLRRAAEAAHAEAELLYSLTSEVAVAEGLDRVYDIALHTVERGARCDRSAILLFDADGVMRFKAWHGLSDPYRSAVEGHSPWTADDLSPKPLAVADTETDPDFASYREVFRSEGVRSLAFVPLIHGKKLVGKFMLYRDEPRAFTSRDLQLASTVAFHVGESIARRRDEQAIAQALAEEREAHAAAEEATRAREEILSVVSHDLRNPLGAILIGASSLLQVDGDRGHRITGIAARMHRQAERMARLIEDLVDFAGIQAGKLTLDRTDHSPDDIINAASDIFTPIALERGLTLETRIAPDLPPIRCDSDRAVQVISNLMSNALKVTPRGGLVSIGAEARDADVVFFVHDDGPGIDGSELPNLFERFWRGKSSPYRGAGLGLSIARGIVDAHGGKIWAESQLGVGSTFYFSLCGRN